VNASVPDPAFEDPDRDPGQPPTLPTVLRALVEDAQTLVEAEAGYLKAVLAFALGRIKSIAIALVLALFFAFFALMALVVGLLLALAPMIGPWAAAGAVTGGLALLAIIFVWRVVRGGRQMIAVLTGKFGDVP
jgi:uncharacterized membrane protein YqjE